MRIRLKAVIESNEGRQRLHHALVANEGGTTNISVPRGMFYILRGTFLLFLPTAILYDQPLPQIKEKQKG
jgi:hypothetical protein